MTPFQKQPIYFANYIGKKNTKNYYSEPIKIYADVINDVLRFKKESAGVFNDFDVILNIPTGSKSNFIDENCVFWVNSLPNTSHDNFDYSVAYLGAFTRNQITIYCKSVTNKIYPLYYSNDNKNIFEFKLEYDKSSKTANVNLNKFIPFNENSLIWTKQPSSVSDTANRISYVGKTNLKDLSVLQFR